MAGYDDFYTVDFVARYNKLYLKLWQSMYNWQIKIDNSLFFLCRDGMTSRWQTEG